MKKILILLIIFCATLTNAQEKGYWVCFNVEVDADGAGDFVRSLDNFMNSDTAKQLPFVITLNEILFANEDNSITHQLCFLAQNADAMANWGSGPPPTPEGIILQMNFQKYVDVKQSILGSPLIFDVKGLGLDYFNIWQFGVKDAATYANAFVKFQKDSRKMMKNATFGLHEAIAGSSKGVTHYFAARATNLAEFLKIRENISNSKAAADFFSKTSPISDIVGVFGGRIIKRYNVN